MAPALSLSVTPPQPAHAQSITGALVSSAMCLAQNLLSAFGELRDILGLLSGAGVGLYVPVRETNPTVIESLRSIRTTSAESARSAFLLLVKECVLDPIVWYLKELMVTRLTQSILGSIETGFLGGPKFETNPIRFFRGVADASFEAFLYDTNVIEGQVLESLQNRIEHALTLHYYAEPYSPDGFGTERHTLSEADYDLLFAGNIMDTEGGLLTLLEFTEDRNNPVGSTMGLTADVGSRMAKVQAQEAALLSFGDGWHSQRCDFGDGTIPDWNVCTPGTWIAQQMDDWSNSSLKQLQVADEFSEIMQALLAALVSEILGNTDTGLLESLPAGYWAGTSREFGSSDGGLTNEDGSLVADDIWGDISDDVQAGAESTRTALLGDIDTLLSRVEEAMLTNPNPDLETIRSELLALRSSVNTLDTSGDPDAVWQALQEYRATYDTLEQEFIAVEAIIPDPEFETDPEAAAALQSELIARLDAVANEVDVWVRYLEDDASANIIIAEIRELQDDIRNVDFDDPLAMGNLDTYAELVDYEEEDYEEWRVEAATEWRQKLLTAIDARLAILTQERTSAIWLRDAYVQLYNNTLASCQASSDLGDSTQALYDSTLTQYNTTLAEYEALQAEYETASSSLATLQLQYEEETDPVVQAELEEQILALEAEIAEMEAELANLESQLNSLQAQLNNLQAQLDGTSGQVADCEAQLAAYQAQIDSLNAQINTLTNQINQLQNLRNDVAAVNPESSDSLPRLLDLERRAETLGVFI